MAPWPAPSTAVTVLLNPILSVTQGLGAFYRGHTTQPNYKYATRDPDHLLVFEEGPVARYKRPDCDMTCVASLTGYWMTGTAE